MKHIYDYDFITRLQFCFLHGLHVCLEFSVSFVFYNERICKYTILFFVMTKVLALDSVQVTIEQKDSEIALLVPVLCKPSQNTTMSLIMKCLQLQEYKLSPLQRFYALCYPHAFMLFLLSCFKFLCYYLAFCFMLLY